jgi:hypothetical protein
MQASPIRGEQLEHVLGEIEKANKQAMIVHNRSWSSEADKTEALETLTSAVKAAKDTVARTEGTQDFHLRSLRSKVLVQAELADGALKDPRLLRR